MNKDPYDSYYDVDDDSEESQFLTNEEAKSSILHYNQVLESMYKFKPIISRSDPRSILFGL